MNTFAKHQMDIEYHQLELRFSHLRISSAAELKKIIISIDGSGQLIPVIAVPSAMPNHFILMDGYLRVRALQRLRQDIVKAEIWGCNEVEALILLLAHQGQRKWDMIEEASVLRELQIGYQMSHEKIAEKIGRTRSWVSHRIALIEILPDKFIQALMQGKLSAWSAQRILVPVARATPSHAEALFEYLQQYPHSTRELSDFLERYQKSNKTAREKMIEEPGLFFKAQKSIQAEKKATLLKLGPEGQWRSRLSNVTDQIRHLEKLIPELFYERQDEKIYRQLLMPLEQVQNDLNRILITTRRQKDDRHHDTSNHYHPASIGKELPGH